MKFGRGIVLSLSILVVLFLYGLFRNVITSKAPSDKSPLANYIFQCHLRLEEIRDEKSLKIPKVSSCNEPKLSLDVPRNYYIESSEILLSPDQESYKINAHRLERNSYFPFFVDRDFWLTFDGKEVKDGKSNAF